MKTLFTFFLTAAVAFGQAKQTNNYGVNIAGDAAARTSFRNALTLGTGDSPTFTGINLSGQTASSIVGFDASKNVISLSTATYPSLTELSYVKGATSAVQTQLNSKLNLSGGTMTGGLAMGNNPISGATSVNGLSIVSNLTNELDIYGGKTFAVTNTLMLSGTDGSTLNIGSGGTLGTGAYATIGNYLPLAGGTMSGGLNLGGQILSNGLLSGTISGNYNGSNDLLFNNINGRFFNSSGYANYANNGYQTDTTGYWIGSSASGSSSGAAMGHAANGSSGGAAMGYYANGSSSGSAMGYQASGSNYGVAIGNYASGSSYGASMGYATDGSSYGAAVGSSSSGSSYGAAVGSSSSGSNGGAAVGYYANGSSGGAAMGYYANGSSSGSAMGYGAEGYNYGVAIGNSALTGGIANRTEIAPKNSGGAIRARISGQSTNRNWQFTAAKNDTAPTDAADAFSNADGTLPRGMLMAQVDSTGTKIVHYYNDAGTIRTISTTGTNTGDQDLSGYLPRNGSSAMTGALDVGSQGITNTGAITGATAITATGKVSNTKIDTTLAAAATALAITNNFVKVTGNAGANTLATITGGVSGQILTILFVDALVTITDTGAATANTVDLSAAWTGSANDTLTLIYDGNKWFETARSVN